MCTKAYVLTILFTMLSCSLLPLTCLAQGEDPSFSTLVKCDGVEFNVPDRTVSCKVLFLELQSLRDFLQEQLALIPENEKDAKTMFENIDNDGVIEGAPLRHATSRIGHWELSETIESKVMFACSQISALGHRYYKWSIGTTNTKQFFASKNALESQFYDLKRMLEIDLGKPSLEQFYFATKKCKERIKSFISEVEKVMGYCRIHGGLDINGESAILSSLSSNCSN
mgnify:CR=1 FL=1